MNINKMNYLGRIGRDLTLAMASCLLCVVTLSCGGNDQTILQRRQMAMKNLTEYYVQRDAGPLWSKIASNTLLALTNATAKSLDRPLLTSAILIQHTNQSVRLWLHWIAAKPLADHVVFEVGDGLSPVNLAIEEQDLKDNDTEAQRTVLFSTGFGWKSGDDIARRLNAVSTPIHSKVRLLRGNVPVTDWFRVDLNRAGNWVRGERL